MATITFFRQAREDGGVRTGIETDDAVVWESFEPGESHDDPALSWYVDLRCESADLPEEADQVRKWLLENAAPICDAFRAAADKVRVGLDAQFEPFEFAIGPASSTEATTMRIVCSAIRRLDARAMAGKLDEIAEHWEKLLRQLSPGTVAQE